LIWGTYGIYLRFEWACIGRGALWRRHLKEGGT